MDMLFYTHLLPPHLYYINSLHLPTIPAKKAFARLHQKEARHACTHHVGAFYGAHTHAAWMKAIGARWRAALGDNVVVDGWARATLPASVMIQTACLPPGYPRRV